MITPAFGETTPVAARVSVPLLGLFNPGDVGVAVNVFFLDIFCAETSYKTLLFCTGSGKAITLFTLTIEEPTKRNILLRWAAY